MSPVHDKKLIWEAMSPSQMLTDPTRRLWADGGSFYDKSPTPPCKPVGGGGGPQYLDDDEEGGVLVSLDTSVEDAASS